MFFKKTLLKPLNFFYNIYNILLIRKTEYQYNNIVSSERWREEYNAYNDGEQRN